MTDIPEPNYTQIPNVVLALMPDMHESELRVVLAICRKTFGWHKHSDTLSLTQLEKMTGLSRPSVKTGIDAAIERGLVARHAQGQSFSYCLLVKPTDQVNDFTSKTDLLEPVKPVSHLAPQLVKPVYTQKKGLNKLKETIDRPVGGELISPLDAPRETPESLPIIEPIDYRQAQPADPRINLMRKLDFDSKQRRTILEARPETPIDFLERWCAWIVTPEADEKDSKFGYAYSRILDGREPPITRKPKQAKYSDVERITIEPDYTPEQIEEMRIRNLPENKRLPPASGPDMSRRRPQP